MLYGDKLHPLRLLLRVFRSSEGLTDRSSALRPHIPEITGIFHRARIMPVITRGSCRGADLIPW